MTLRELFAPYPSDQKVYVTVTNGELYEGTIADCPIHILGDEVQKARSIDNELVVKVKREVSTMTWDELRRAIQSMPEWARMMPARIYIDPCKRYVGDEDYGIGTILTYYCKEPSEIQDDGVDFVVMDIDAPFVQKSALALWIQKPERQVFYLLLCAKASQLLPKSEQAALAFRSLARLGWGSAGPICLKVPLAP